MAEIVKIKGVLLGTLDYEKLLEKVYLEYFAKELEKVQRGEVDVKKLIVELKELPYKGKQMHEQSSLFDIKQFDLMVAQSFFMLEQLEEYEKEVRDDVIAAISYFVNEDDAISDDDMLEGFDDDYAVMKAVVDFRELKGPMSES